MLLHKINIDWWLDGELGYELKWNFVLFSLTLSGVNGWNGALQVGCSKDAVLIDAGHIGKHGSMNIRVRSHGCCQLSVSGNWKHS